MWCQRIFNTHGRYIKNNAGSMMTVLHALQKALTTQKEALGRLCDDNKYMLGFLISMLESHAPEAEEEQLEEEEGPGSSAPMQESEAAAAEEEQALGRADMAESESEGEAEGNGKAGGNAKKKKKKKQQQRGMGEEAEVEVEAGKKKTAEKGGETSSAKSPGVRRKSKGRSRKRSSTSE